MCISPVWGSPGDDQLDDLPSTAVVTVERETGVRLREALAVGEVVVLLDAAVDTGWRQTPILVGDLAGPRGADGPFVLLSGHHDTWHYGVMDNGGANATMLEVARVCALAREHWCRGLRVAFWSGHSQGRYSGSAWYADTHWEELDRRAVAHVNVDSTGGRGNTVVSDTSASEELAALAREALAAQAGQEFSGRRTERAGDQSFWGIGVPSIFANMSEQPAGGDVNAMGAVIGAGTRRGAGTGWWWHTPDDTEDKIDGEILLRDTRIYQHAVWRLLATPVPPLDFASAAHALVETLSAAPAGGRRRARPLPLPGHGPAPSRRRAVRLQRAGRDGRGRRRRTARGDAPPTLARAGAARVHAGRPLRPRPGVGAVADPGARETLRSSTALDADGRRFLASRLVRESNRVAHALEQALARARGRVTDGPITIVGRRRDRGLRRRAPPERRTRRPIRRGESRPRRGDPRGRAPCHGRPVTARPARGRAAARGRRSTVGLVLLAVKAQDTVTALEPIVPRLAPEGIVVSLQNGLEEYRIAAAVGAGPDDRSIADLRRALRGSGHGRVRGARIVPPRRARRVDERAAGAARDRALGSAPGRADQSHPRRTCGGRPQSAPTTSPPPWSTPTCSSFSPTTSDSLVRRARRRGRARRRCRGRGLRARRRLRPRRVPPCGRGRHPRELGRAAPLLAPTRDPAHGRVARPLAAPAANRGGRDPGAGARAGPPARRRDARARPACCRGRSGRSKACEVSSRIRRALVGPFVSFGATLGHSRLTNRRTAAFIGLGGRAPVDSHSGQAETRSSACRLPSTTATKSHASF